MRSLSMLSNPPFSTASCVSAPSKSTFSTRRETFPSLLSWRETQLLHDLHGVKFAPLFLNLAVHDAPNRYAPARRFLSRCREAISLASICASRRPYDRNQVIFRYGEDYGHLQIRKSLPPAVHRRLIFLKSNRRSETVVDEVGRVDFVGYLVLALIEDFLKDATRNGFVLLLHWPGPGTGGKQHQDQKERDFIHSEPLVVDTMIAATEFRFSP